MIRRALRRWGAALSRPPRRAISYTYAINLLQNEARAMRALAERMRLVKPDDWEWGANDLDRKADVCILAMRALIALETAVYGDPATAVTS